MGKAKELGFRILQFNAVVASNAAALHLYKKLGFVQLGAIPAAFSWTTDNTRISFRTISFCSAFGRKEKT
jgi:hypothetical protein